MTGQIIRVIPNAVGYMGQGEQFYDISKLTWKQQKEVRDELAFQGFFVQDIFLSDPMPVQIGAEIRRRTDDEPEGKQ